MKPIAAIRLVNGRCACTACRADAARDDAYRDQWYSNERRNANPVVKG